MRELTVFTVATISNLMSKCVIYKDLPIINVEWFWKLSGLICSMVRHHV